MDEERAAWKPLSERQNPNSTYGELHEGVPDWLRSSLIEWMRRRIMDNPAVKPAQMLHWIELTRRIPLYSHPNLWLTFEDLVGKADADEVLFLDIIDLLAALLHPSHEAVEELTTILALGGSAWRVRGDRDQAGLERRVDETVQQVADGIIRRPDRPGQYLSKAWHAAFGRNPSADTAYRDAVRAVEAAAIPVVEPNNSKATLGTTIAEIRQNRAKFSVALQPSDSVNSVDVVLDMMQLLWKSQFDRHGTPDDAVPLTVSQEEAEAAVILALTLVHWFTSGAVTRVP